MYSSPYRRREASDLNNGVHKFTVGVDSQTGVRMPVGKNFNPGWTLLRGLRYPQSRAKKKNNQNLFVDQERVTDK